MIQCLPWGRLVVFFGHRSILDDGTIKQQLYEVVEDLIVNGGGGSVDNELVIQLQTNIEELSIKTETLTSQLLVLQGDESVEGSVDYKINDAFRWKDLN